MSSIRQIEARALRHAQEQASIAAAAPALLAALKWALDQMPEPVLPGEYSLGYYVAKKTIAKAEGRNV